LLAAGILACTSLAGCSISPVYGDHAASGAHYAFRFAKPGNRLEQVIYHDLALRFYEAAGPEAPLVSVTAYGSGYGLTRSKTSEPQAAGEARVTATTTVTQDGKTLTRFTRFATAEYTTGDQVLANNQALQDAEERAAGSAAESIALSLLAALGP
jgi:LPS-assembly lipoprotein